MGIADVAIADVGAVLAAPEKTTEKLDATGITEIQDAMVTPHMCALYATLQAQGHLTERAPWRSISTPRPTAAPTHASTTTAWSLERTPCAPNTPPTRIHADTVKRFADGVLEGNPYGTPPSPPESPSPKPYLHEIFGNDAKGGDVGAGLGRSGRSGLPHGPGRAGPLRPAGRHLVFMHANGFHPGQREITSGRLQHDPAVIAEYLKRVNLAGFTLHIHAIADQAVRTTVDAIKAARAADCNASRPDTIAHAQLVSPEDMAHFGRDHLFVAFTYAWSYADPEYDLSVIPFVDKVKDGACAATHNPAGYYERQAYPTRSIKTAGAVLAAAPTHRSTRPIPGHSSTFRWR
jgi:hypothetical protein